MKVKMKVKTLAVIIATVIIVLAGAMAVKGINSDEFGPDQLISLILKADPTGDDYIYISPNSSGYTTIESSVTDEQAIEYVQQMIEQYPEHDWTKRHSDWMLANLYRKKGNWEKALEKFRKVAEGGTHNKEQAAQWVEILDTSPPQPDEEPVLSGRILIGDHTVNRAYVYLIPADAKHWRSPPNFYYPMTATDEAGVYRFYDVEPGKYEVGIGLHPSQIGGYVMTEQEVNTVSVTSSDHVQFDVQFVLKAEAASPVDGVTIAGDTITFKWEPYPGAASYRIGIGELLINEDGEFERSGIQYLNEQWEGTSVQYAIDDLRKRHPGNSSTSQEGLDPFSVLGLVYPGGHFTWVVDALDENGNRISTSSGYYTNQSGRFPVFSIDDAGQLEGDRYVLERNYDKAIAAYEQQPDHPYALRALAKIYFKGTELNSDKHKDIDKALEYFKQIPDLTEEEQDLIKSIEKRKSEWVQ